jgi:hypothetical protein
MTSRDVRWAEWNKAHPSTKLMKYSLLLGREAVGCALRTKNMSPCIRNYTGHRDYIGLSIAIRGAWNAPYRTAADRTAVYGKDPYLTG